MDVDVSGIAADSLGARRIGAIAWDIAQRHVRDALLLPDAAIRAAQLWLWQEIKLAVEPAAALGLAALQTGACVPPRTRRSPGALRGERRSRRRWPEPRGTPAAPASGPPNKIAPMLDITLLRKDLTLGDRAPGSAQEAAGLPGRRGLPALEAERKAIQTRTEELQARRNQLSKQIGQRKAKGEPVDAVMAEVAQRSRANWTVAPRGWSRSSPRWRQLLLPVPNLPHESVPVGADEKGNVKCASGARRAQFDFAVQATTSTSASRWAWTSPPASSSAASRFTVMKGQVARLHRALAQFMLDMQTQAHGYTECYTPYIVNRRNAQAAPASCPSSRATCSR